MTERSTIAGGCRISLLCHLRPIYMRASGRAHAESGSMHRHYPSNLRVPLPTESECTDAYMEAL